MFDIDVTTEGEKGATTEQFLKEVKQALGLLNESWSRIKADLPADEQAAAEAKVRAVLRA